MLTIGQVASRAGLRPSAIRYYETQGVLPKAPRIGGRRIYDASVLRRLAMIHLAKSAGFGLAEIRALIATADTHGPRPTWRLLARAKRVELDRQMDELARRKEVLARLTDCCCETLDECGRHSHAAVRLLRVVGTR